MTSVNTMLVEGTYSVNRNSAVVSNETRGVTDGELENDTFGVTTDPSVHWPAGLPSEYTWTHIICVAILVAIIIVIIVFGNILVIIAVATDRNLKSPQNWFIASLAVADMLLGACIIPFSLANELMGYWFFGSILCDLWLAIDVLLCTASIMSLCLISLDRYWSITRAVHYAQHRTPRKAATLIAIVWILSAVICLPPLIGWKQPRPNLKYYECTLSDDIGYVLYSSNGSFFVPLFIMLFVYFKIYLAARERARRSVPKTKFTKSEHKEKSSSSTTSFNTPPKNKKDQKAAMNHNTTTKQPESDNVSNMSEDESSWPVIYTEVKTTTEIIQDGVQKLVDETSKLLPTDIESQDTQPKLTTTDSESTDMFDQHPISSKHIIIITDTDSSMQSPKHYTLDANAKKGHDDESKIPLMSNCNVQKSVPTAEHRHKSCSEEGSDQTCYTSCNETPKKEANNQQNKQTQDTKTSKSLLKATSVKKLKNAASKEANHKSKTKHRKEKGWKSSSIKEAERQKRKLAKARERRATIVLGIVVITFTFCWLPFFSLYVVSAFCHGCIPKMVFTFFFWIGYCNSALNPVIYTIFNRDFKQAFHRIVFNRLLCCKKS